MRGFVLRQSQVRFGINVVQVRLYIGKDCN